MKKLATVSARSKLSLLLALAGTLVLGAGLLSVTLFYGLNFDESYNSQISRNLVRYGAYGSRTSDGLRWFDPHVSTGPVVLLPVALSFLGFGDGILQARLVSLAFALLTLLVLGVLSKRLFGPVAAGLAVLLFATTGQVFWILGMVLGEGAAVCTILAGILVWSIAEERRSPGHAFGAGILWGLSVWAKPSMAMAVLFIVGCLAICVLLKEPMGVVLPALGAGTSIVVAALWLALPILFSIQSGQSLQAGVASSLVSQQLSLTILENAFLNAQILLQTLGGGILLAAAFGMHQLRRMEPLRVSKLLVYIVPGAWITWWVLFNGPSEYRHLVPGILIGTIPLAHALVLLFERRGGIALSVYRILLTGLVIVGLVQSAGSIADHFGGLAESHELKDAQSRFAVRVASLEPDADIYGLGWLMAWDIAFLSDRSFGRLGSASELPEGRSFLVVTPATQRNPKATKSILDIASRCSGVVVFEEPPWFRLYELEAPCKGN